MNIETDSRNIESEKTLYGVSKASDHEEYTSYFKPGLSPERNRKTANPIDTELETQYKQYLTPTIESFNSAYEDTQEEKSNSIILIVIILIVFVSIFYLSKKYISVEHRELEVPVGITTEESPETEEES